MLNMQIINKRTIAIAPYLICEIVGGFVFGLLSRWDYSYFADFIVTHLFLCKKDVYKLDCKN